MGNKGPKQPAPSTSAGPEVSENTSRIEDPTFSVNDRVLVYFHQRLYEARVLKAQLFEEQWWRFYICYLVKDPPKWQDNSPRKQKATSSQKVGNSRNRRVTRNVHYTEPQAEGWTEWHGWKEWVTPLRIVERTHDNFEQMRDLEIIQSTPGSITWEVHMPKKEQGPEDPLQKIWEGMEEKLGLRIPSTLLMEWIEDEELSLHVGEIVDKPGMTVYNMIKEFKDDLKKHVAVGEGKAQVKQRLKNINKLLYIFNCQFGKDSSFLFRTERDGPLDVLRIEPSKKYGVEHLIRIMVKLYEIPMAASLLKSFRVDLQDLIDYLDYSLAPKSNREWVYARKVAGIANQDEVRGENPSENVVNEGGRDNNHNHKDNISDQEETNVGSTSKQTDSNQSGSLFSEEAGPNEQAVLDPVEGMDPSAAKDTGGIRLKRSCRLSDKGMEIDKSSSVSRRHVGLLYDDRMCKHQTSDGEHHPENPNRIISIWNKLKSSDIIKRCIVITAKEAGEDQIALVHTKAHINLIRDISSKTLEERNKFAENFNSVYFNEGSSEAAYLAAGSVIEVAEKVANGELTSAFAIVRPPGHHAEENEPMGFCLYNNVAIAASFLLDVKVELGVKNILIVDWDVHHGNGTQNKFYKDPRVLFFSVHRHDHNFFPKGVGGTYSKTGAGPGVGYNINIPWKNDNCGDADYLAVWDHVLIPVAKAFDPDLVIISAGFDAAIGDPLGGCRVSPGGFAMMLSKLMTFAEGKIIMALEGGYNLDSIAESTLACLHVLLGDKPCHPVLGSPKTYPYPFESTWEVINKVRNKLSDSWPVLAEKLPENITNKKIPYAKILSSDSEVELVNVPSSRNHATDIEKVVGPLLKSKLGEDTTVSPSWRSELSKIDVWYATYESKMWNSRFLCYIVGGKVKGMQKPCTGSVDKSPPKEIIWRTFPHRLFFACDNTAARGRGGVAFLNPESCSQDTAYMCLYKITLEQFNDILLQENVGNYDNDSSIFDSSRLAAVKLRKSLNVEALKGGRYHNVVYLGDEIDIPILTVTCTTEDVGHFKSRKAMRLPGKEYLNTLIKGLVEGKQLSKEEANAYIKGASTKEFC